MVDSARPRVVILGAGFGGLAVARGLGSAPVELAVIDRQNHHLFQPLLYQVATAGLSGTDIAQPIRHILRRHRNVVVLRGEIGGVDRGRREVLLEERRIRYDVLVVATGATHNYFGHDDWAEAAPGLKTLADAQRVRDRVLEAFETAEATADPAERRRALSFAVVGGGPTGVELAGSIAELARHTLVAEFRKIDPRIARVMLFEAGPRILPSFPAPLVGYAERKLADLGVELRAGAAIDDITAAGVRVGDELVPAQTVLWAAGVRATPVGRWLGVPTDRAGRIEVDDRLRLPGPDDVYVIGDAALARDPEGRPLPGLAQVAQQQGRYVARAILAAARGAPAPPFRYRDRGSWAIIGRHVAIAHVDSQYLRGRIAWFAWGLVHIAFLVGFENRVRVLLKWLWEYLTYRRGARLIVDAPREARRGTRRAVEAAASGE